MTSGSPPRVAASPSAPMGPLRRAVAVAVIAGVFGLHALVLWRDKETWPFSQYPMYSWLEPGPTLYTLRLMGVPEGSPDRELWIQADEYILPFDQSRLFDALVLIQKDPDAQERTAAALRDVFDRYERRRLHQDHAGPRLVSMRLYEVNYDLKLDASNVDHPERSHLIAEVR